MRLVGWIVRYVSTATDAPMLGIWTFWRTRTLAQGEPMETTMAFIDPNRPKIGYAEQSLPRHDPASAFDDQPRVHGWTANRPRSSGLMLAGGLMAALVIAGWVTFSAGKFETGNVTNASPANIDQRTIAPTVSSTKPTTAGQAPAR